MLSLLFLFWKTNCQQHLLFENMPLSSYLENSFWKKKMPWTFKQIPIYSYKWIFLHIYTLICLHIFVFNARSISTKHLKDSKYIMIPVWSLFTKEFETSRVFPCRTKKLRVFAFGEARNLLLLHQSQLLGPFRKSSEKQTLHDTIATYRPFSAELDCFFRLSKRPESLQLYILSLQTVKYGHSFTKWLMNKRVSWYFK